MLGTENAGDSERVGFRVQGSDWDLGGVVNTGFARPIGSGAEGDDFAVLFIINGRSIATRGLAGDQGGAAQCSEGTGGKIGSRGTYGFL
jgi:hypothetical protein